MRIAVLDDWAGVARDMAEWDGLGEVTVFTDPIPADRLAETLRPFEAICLMRERTPFPAALIEALPELRLIVTTGSRNLSIDVAAARARGIVVSGTPSRKTSTAELTLALVLHQCRRIGTEAARLDKGGFQGPPGRDLADLRVGLVGLGNIGTQVATLLRAFGAEVAAWSPNLTAERAADAGVAPAPDLRALAAGSDVLSVHMVLAESTRHLLGAEALAALPAGAVVVNTSRAGLLDRDALFDWLGRDPAARAAIDVFETEPLPAEDPWRAARRQFGDRLLLTPHLGYVTQATWRLFYQETAAAVAAFQDGNPIRTL
ncbi:lactate dehydrogenase-like 2-hydroxyacid dehydrogenase [Palleronia aestuarii]|uniref:Lactate dehydrogenase-like 2-hydroxyacid dehydrogenase n=1 Tax=Palleronia aestuarii TaxID=568105 RepID=A0A2W7PXU7_9RHOB|nr:D-2-hydroxyacid dehydrogenase family protein [Palleronia aestuarii]PZX14369.1 lactate dehydrogenase-like 2-hydroxyacid dehydrogenase [Palleronia aestuarii]